jgi:hypothetical protein
MGIGSMPPRSASAKRTFLPSNVWNLSRKDYWDEPALRTSSIQLSLKPISGFTKRYRVDTEKLQKAVAKEFAAKRDKKTVKAKTRKAA